MSKKWVGASLLAIGMISFWAWETNIAKEQQENKSEEKITSHPGWYGHYNELKGLDGNTQKGLMAQWYKTDRTNTLHYKKAENNLDNILEIGPFNVGGRTRSIVIDHSNKNRYICAAISGGIWISENEGESWAIVDEQAPTLSATSITQSPFDKNMFYYGTGEPMGNSADLGGLGLFRSTDGAASFEHLEHTMITSLTGIWSVVHSLTMDSTLYVGTNAGGLWRSTDAAATFEQIYSSSRRIHEVKTFEDGTLVISEENRGLTRIDESTLVATSLRTNGWPTGNIGRISFEYVRDYPDVMYSIVAGSDNESLNGVYKTSNGGRTWSATASEPTALNIPFSWYCLVISTAPTDSNFVLVASATRPMSSTNGGASWSLMGDSHADYHYVAWIDDESMLIGNDGGIYRYRKSNMQSFTDLNNGLNITQFYAGHYYPNDDDIVGGTQDNGTQLTVDKNQEFSRINSGDGAFCAVNQQDDNIRYVSSQNLNVRRQENGTSVSISRFIRNAENGDAGVWFISPFEINTLDGDQLYVPTRGATYRTTDGGRTWATITGDLLGDSYAVGLSQDVNPTAYIGGTASRIYRVNNALTASDGDEVSLWDNNKRPDLNFLASTIGCIEVDPNDAGTIYCGLTNVRDRARIWRIREADTDTPIWDDIHANLPESLPVNWVEVDPDMPDHIMIATDYGLYSSLNGGASWNKEDRLPNVPIDQIRLRHSDRKLFIYTHGRGIWTADLKDNLVANTKEKVLLDVGIYPNPTSDYIQITQQPSRVTIYDAMGQIVHTSSNQKIAVTDWKSGTYFVEVMLEGATTVKKIIVSN